ncbi:oligosaccharide flippase family protein [Bacteroidia bacterium]|jgi:O-antigen/teichoic acid export membrane protein|nr:oligosaccharide flippase family protein [Bacteroidia bacterium]
MLKKYLGDIAFMQVLNLLVKPIWILVIDAAVQEALPQAVYGNYFALFNTSLLFFIVLDLGLNSFNITEVAQDNRKIRSLTGSIIGLKILLAILYIVIILCVGAVLGYSAKEFVLLIILGGIQVVTSLNQFFRSIVASLQHFRIDGIFMVLDRVLVILFVGVLLWSNIPQLELTIYNFAYAQLFSLSLVLVSLLVFLRGHLAYVSISFDLDNIFPILKKSWPFALLVTLMGLYTYIDGVMIKELVGDAEAGVYALGYRFYFALLMFASVFSGVLLPLFSKNLKNIDIIRSISGFTSRLLLFGGIVASLIAVVYAMEILTFVNPDKANTDSAQVLVILLVGFIGSSLTMVYGALLTAGKELTWLNRFAAFTLVVNLILNSILIPQYKAQGAAIATMVSQLLFGFVCLLVSIKKYNLNITLHSLVTPAVGVIFLVLIILFGQQYAQNMCVHFSMIAITILLSAYLFKLYSVNDLKSLLKK